MGQCGSSQEEEASQSQLLTARNTNDTDTKNGNHTPTKKTKTNNGNQDDNKESDKLFKQPGVSNLKLTYDLETDLKELQKHYSKYKDLIPRNFKNILKDDIHDAEKNKNTMTIMQFNMLADGLSGAYTIKETEKTFIGVDKTCLEFTYRMLRIVEELTRFKPDIITIEECDTIKFLMKYLTPMGYLYEFQEKTSSPVQEVIEEIAEERNGVRPTMENDGVSIIYKKDKFETIGPVQRIDMKDNKEKVFALAVPLRCKQSKNKVEFLVVCTHLKSTKAKEGEELREKQIRSLFKDLIKNEKRLPIIMGTDLNANPTVNRKGYGPLCYNALTGENCLGFRSCYQIALGKEPEYTTWKLRVDGTDKHVLDYIFINDDKWKVAGYLEIPTASEDAKSLIPNWDYPSDHFSIMVKLIWN